MKKKNLKISGLLFFLLIFAQINFAQTPIGDSDNGVTTILLPEGGGLYAGGSPLFGAIKIKLPVSYSSTMLKVWIDVYNYKTNESSTAIASGYNYIGGGGYWTRCSGQILASDKSQLHSIYFGNDGSNSIIWVGEQNTEWRYLGARITKVQASANNTDIDTWDSGWVVSLDDTDFKTNYSPVSVTNTQPFSNWKRSGDNISYTDGSVGIGMSAENGAPLSITKATEEGVVSKNALHVYRQTKIDANVTSYDKAIRSYFTNFTIPAGITDNGYKVALDASSYSSTNNLAGTIRSTYGVWARTGIHTSEPTGRINNAYSVLAELMTREGTVDNGYGVYISSPYTTGSIVNQYDLYASSAEANNYFAGSLGIGINKPKEKIHSKGNFLLDVYALGNENGLFFRENYSDANKYNLSILTYDHTNAGASADGLSINAYDGVSFSTGSNTRNERMRIDKNGNVGIGTTVLSNDYKLAVSGKIRALEVKVQPLPWADFVFEDTYELRSLEEVENHINEKGHLPDIPSAEEVEKEGIDLGAMDAKLLQKIEELTLYLIDQDKRLNTLQEENHSLQQQLIRLENKK